MFSSFNFSQKELVIKLERSDPMSLQRIGRRETSPSPLPNNSFPSRKTSASKNYCEDESEGEDDDTLSPGRSGKLQTRRRSELPI